jgi:hypothetical protein
MTAIIPEEEGQKEQPFLDSHMAHANKIESRSRAGQRQVAD